MLNIWPNLLSYSFFAPLLLRLAIGFSTIYFGYHTHRAWASRGRWLGIVWILAGILVLIGLGTQVAAVALIALLLLKFWGFGDAVKWTWSYDLLLFATLLALLLTGAGGFAFDLPL